MPDLAHAYGSDLSWDATGDLAAADGTVLGQQRVLRRLLTNPGAYIWHLDYGAGLPLFVGETVNVERIEAVARTQMFREDVVSRDPAPSIDVAVLPLGVVSLTIRYADAPSQTPVVLSFNLTG